MWLLQDRNLLLDNPAGKLKRARTGSDPARHLLSGSRLKGLGLQHPVPGQCKYDPSLSSALHFLLVFAQHSSNVPPQH